MFPRRMTAEVTYGLSGRWGDFFDHVQDYCIEQAAGAEQQQGQAARLIWYATLALLRCVASSPAAAARALTTRLSGSLEEMEHLAEDGRLFDGQAEDLTVSDLEPAARLDDAASSKRPRLSPEGKGIPSSRP